MESTPSDGHQWEVTSGIISLCVSLLRAQAGGQTINFILNLAACNLSHKLNLINIANYLFTEAAFISLKWDVSLSLLDTRLVSITFLLGTTMCSGTNTVVYIILVNNSEWLIAFTVDANVICTGTNIVIEIEQLHSVGLHKDYLRLNDPACTLDSNGTHVLANFSLNACGTMIEVKLFSWAKGTV